MFGSRRAVLSVLRLWIVDLNLNMSSKKCKGSCLSASAKKALRGKSRGVKVSKTFDQNWADAGVGQRFLL